MEKLGRPKGLIRYGSQAKILPQPGEKPHMVRPRLIVYALLLLVVWTAFFAVLLTRPPAYVSIRRGTGAPFYALPSGEIANPVRVSIINRTNDLATYVVSVDPAAGRLIADKLEVTLIPAQAAVLPVTLAAMPTSFEHGQHAVQVRVVADGSQASKGYEKTFTYRMLGPTHQRASQRRNQSHFEGDDREAPHPTDTRKEDK
jgi:polyferredoxin